MRPVIRVSLNGHARQLEDDAHALLTQYLDAAARTLDGNPDRAEILADLERSIAEKSARFLVGGREVLERAQIALVLDEIGPVEPASNGAAADATSTRGPAETGGAGPATGPAPARLRQISDGAMISGLCNGIAAWAGLDVTIVRIVAVVLAFATGGAAIFVYLLLMFIVPYASGPAASHALPRASRSLVEKVRGQTAEFARSEEWQQLHADVHEAWDRAASRVRSDWRAWRGAGGASATTSLSPAVVLALVVLLLAAIALG